MAENPPAGRKSPKKIAGVDLKWWLIGGVGTIAIVYLAYKHSANSAAAATTTTDTSTDSSIDPATGIPYADETGESYGGAYGTTPSMYGYYDPTTGQYITNGSGSTAVVTAPSTNAAWAQQAVAYFEGLGYDATTVSAALGNYLTGQTLTASQNSLISSILALQGAPPVNVPPPTITPPSGQTGTLPKIANGYYRDISTGNIYQVVNNVRYAVTPSTWAKLEKSKVAPKLSTITKSWTGYQLSLNSKRV